MKNETITALTVEPNEHLKTVQLHTDLDSLQKAISIGADYQGLIELVNLDEYAVILCNEEGKLISLPVNRRIGCDVIAGVFHAIGSDKHSNLISLTAQQLESYKARFWESENLSVQDVKHAMFMRFFTV